MISKKFSYYLSLFYINKIKHILIVIWYFNVVLIGSPNRNQVDDFLSRKHFQLVTFHNALRIMLFLLHYLTFTMLIYHGSNDCCVVA